ncbi:transposase [Rodentibacter rarus]|uniref:Transposase n=1 Tax=Rodentibacter rarus TaxID=1908260 RepID=A0A1V3IL90_9PAST|nr:transposase [Rodentibacter rarus]OOF42533.1 transposase [Rodentibacter rarus]
MSPFRYGYPLELAPFRRVEQLGFKGKCKLRQYHSYQGEMGKIADNPLKQNFVAQGANEKWVTDVTELKCVEGKLYLSPIKGLFNGEIISYDLSPSPNFEQITKMMEQAVRRLDSAKPILHSDQGW